MELLKVIIVDDELAARNVLSNLLVRCKINVDIVARCEDVLEAVKAIKKHQPDVVFLDVQMPEYAGYEIVNFFDEIDFEIIFVTAYDQYAIKAFELSAVDYIVKPIERSRLDEAVEKLNDKLRQKTAYENYQVLLESVRSKELGKIVISELKDGQLLHQTLNLSDIIAVEAMGAYSKVYLKDAPSIILSRNLKHFEERLPETDVFFRTHRSWLINSGYIESYRPRFGKIVLKNQLEVKLSKKRQETFEELYAS
ncbi:MAG: LytTR family DNA-binding domain-containing protein [Flavobacteriales bacterium]|jgi:two-component system LytT family response regulator|nr:LytTR family DNA-binding domain-containing protein [Flavobacteriales bacterium]